jgi:hypothetical protein
MPRRFNEVSLQSVDYILLYLKLDFITKVFIFSLIHDITCSNFHEKMSNSSIQNQTSAIVGIDLHFLRCVNDYSYRTNLFWAVVVIVSAISIVKFIIGTI